MTAGHSTAPSLDRDLELVLRGAISDDESAIAAALEFVGALGRDVDIEPSVYATLPPLCTRLGPLGDQNDPRWNVLRGVARRVWAHNQLCLAAAQSALDAMTCVDAPGIVLPGALTAMAAVGDVGARVFERTDVLVDPEHVPRITAALLATGATIRQSHAPLLEGRVSSQPLLYAELASGALVVRWDHPALGDSELRSLRTRAQALHIGALRAMAPVAPDVLVAVLAALSDTDPGPTGWTNLVLELARVARVTADDPAAFDAAACSGHAVGRHGAWAELLAMVADLSADPRLAIAAERFRAVPPPAAPPTDPSGPPSSRSAPSRAARMLLQYRTEARQRDEPVTVRGLAGYLTRRWRLGDRRQLAREAVHRVVRARGAQLGNAPPSNSASNESSTSSE